MPLCLLLNWREIQVPSPVFCVVSQFCPLQRRICVGGVGEVGQMKGPDEKTSRKSYDCSVSQFIRISIHRRNLRVAGVVFWKPYHRFAVLKEANRFTLSAARLFLATLNFYGYNANKAEMRLAPLKGKSTYSSKEVLIYTNPSPV